MIVLAFVLLLVAFGCFAVAALDALSGCTPWSRSSFGDDTLLLLFKASGVLALSALGALAIGLVE